MSRLFDFTYSNPKTKSQVSSECAVVVNNTIHPCSPKSEERPIYPPEIAYPPMTSPPSVEPTLRSTASEDWRHELDKTLYRTLRDILITNNTKLLGNIIDTSHRIIIDADSVIQAIAIITGNRPESILLRCSQPETGCLMKISKIVGIEEIKVNSLDFKLTYNDKYNILTEEYGISLSKTFKT
jgi:hypothetical protein